MAVALFDPGGERVEREVALDARGGGVFSAPSRLRAPSPPRALAGPPPVLVAEDERNDPALVTELGLGGVWADDFHHALHGLLTGERFEAAIFAARGPLPST
jgi:hypothetical protein